MADEFVARIQERYRGQMEEADVAFLRDIQRLAKMVEDGECAFSEFVSAAYDDFRSLVIDHKTTDVTKAIASGFRSSVASRIRNASKGEGHATANELEFLKNVNGVIEFAIRNGLRLGFQLAVLAHDLDEIHKHAGLEEALAAGFFPKATGWAKRNQEVVGEAEEPME